ncbi:MAG: LysM peptidoglycan-binding domain-containing protein [Verrucomicrobia bacterium]|nr:LysM peptidoglycan-binding domain-containing protein [Verrucomicrobiota bacterium]
MLLASSLAISLVSCANRKNDYDTSNPYGTPHGDQAPTISNTPYQPGQPANPIYDTPPAYEESTATPVAPATPNVLPPTTPATGGASPRGTTVHTVVARDTLSGIADKYKVPMASIKKANGMTKDTVVLGKKLVIPAH